MHIFSFDRSCEMRLCYSSVLAEASTSVTLTWCTNKLKLIRMLKYRNNTYNNSFWQQQTPPKKKLRKNKSAEKTAEFHRLAEKDHVCFVMS